MKLSYREIPGLVSPHALAEHLHLAELEEQAAPQSAYDLAGAFLHLVFFSGLTPADNSLLDTGPFRAKLEQRWASTDGWWQNEMRPAAMKARGWAVLAQNGGQLRTFVLEGHDHGALFGWLPIVAVDCYEHAYWMDFGSGKAAYLDALYEHLNWSAIAARYSLGG